VRAGTDQAAAGVMSAAALAIALGLGAPAAAIAQPSAAAAATLQFDKGRTLMKEKKYAEACAAFEQSQKLDPQIGTLYNLGGCYAELGKIASAWNAYREVGQRDANPGRKKEANRRAKELEQRLPKLVLTIASPPPPGLAVTMNGADVTPLLGAVSPVDPAEYKLKATAPGYAAWETTAKISDEGKTITIAIELRRPAAKEPIKPATSPGSRSEPEPGTLAAGGEAREARTDEGPSAPGRPAPQRRKQLALVVGGAGAASLGAGLVFGTLARRKWDEAKALCGGDTVCEDPAVLARGNALVDDARGHARISTVLVGSGAILLGAGAVLWLTAPSHRAASDTASDTALRITPQLGPGLAAVTLGGTFR
jgi:tetratricopeptide (TPR) repeat protein